MSKILEDLRYADSHEWVRLEGDIALSAFQTMHNML